MTESEGDVQAVCELDAEVNKCHPGHSIHPRRPPTAVWSMLGGSMIPAAGNVPLPNPLSHLTNFPPPKTAMAKKGWLERAREAKSIEELETLRSEFSDADKESMTQATFYKVQKAMANRSCVLCSPSVKYISQQ